MGFIKQLHEIGKQRRKGIPCPLLAVKPEKIERPVLSEPLIVSKHPSSNLWSLMLKKMG
jgi:hypothetical protein